MSSETAEAQPVAAALSTLGAVAAELAEIRLALLANELEERLLRLGRMAVLAALALFCFGLAVILACAALVVYFWDTHRLGVLGGLTAGALAAFLLLGWRLQRNALAMPPLFAASMAALRQDSASLRR